VKKKQDEKRGPGRPPRAGTAATGRIELRVTDDERAAWMAAAELDGETLSDWMRARLNRAARRVL
jgi:uncharacterized protein (DUF1778 family)